MERQGSVGSFYPCRFDASACGGPTDLRSSEAYRSEPVQRIQGDTNQSEVNMKRRAAVIAFCLCIHSSAFSQMTFTDLASYCRVVSEASTPVLLARTEGVQRSEAEAVMNEMTDPLAIRMVKEAIEFAYSRPGNTGLDRMRT